MTSRVVLEGVLDIKDPRGSEDRKFWKAWRRQWISFSVIYPSGRKEPHLLLNIFHSSSDNPERQIRIARDGLRLFRCRSKSRPYRTWAIMSGHKLVLYFAAESEIQAQNWIQEVRDGLWPPCFSFQMLTACSHEVSLIDNENTFISGLLGVYGRFVLTSNDVISLMHPHWGSTSLQISLENIQDVLFVREAEISPAGVFSIVLKRVEESKVKALQFFCNRAVDAIQWILSKVFEKNSEKNKEASKNKILNSVSDTIVSTQCNILTNMVNGYTDSYLTNLSSFSSKTDNTVCSSNEYENLRDLKVNSVSNIGESSGQITDNALNSGVYSEVNKRNSLKDASESAFWKHSTTKASSVELKNVINDNQNSENKSSNSKLNESSLYANVGYENETIKSPNHANNYFKDAVVSNNSSTKYTNVEVSSESFDSKETVPTAKSPNNNSDYAVYSVVNKGNTFKVSDQRTLKVQFLTNESSRNEENIISDYLSEAKTSEPALDDSVFSSKSLSENHKEGEVDYSVPTSTNKIISNCTPIDIRIYGGKLAGSNDDLSTNKRLPFYPPHTSHSLVYDMENQLTISKNSSEQMHKVQLFTNDLSTNFKDFKTENLTLLPNISSDFLNTSFTNSVRLNKKTGSESSSSEDDTETLPWMAFESNSSDFGERVYEDILDRKDTIYEDIDESESDGECTSQLPPALPNRPQNLEIPSSLRLQKLSKSIKQTLEIIESKEPPAKEYPCPSFIKKIKEASRIMQISPNQEFSREPFTVETKFPVGVKNVLTLTPTAEDSPENIDNVPHTRNAILNLKQNAD